MPRKKHPPEEIFAKLRQIDVLVSEGSPVTGAIRQIGVTAVTYCRWRQEYGADWIAIARDVVPPMPCPAMLLGDFNMMPNSREYVLLTGPAGPDYGRLVEQGLFADALTLSGGGEQAGVTYPANSIEQAMRIDHIFMTIEFAGLVRCAWIDEAADASDHQPVFAELKWPASG